MMDRRWSRPLSCAAMTILLGVAACSSSRPGGSPSQWGQGNYTPPGPSSDPWGPYIREAASRFSVPEAWIRAVMNQESGGHQYMNGELTQSGAGAMGLMQLMPATWSDLASNNGLGDDPFDPHDNILAGAAYIRQMYDRFGSPGFLAAYNAGPGRVEQYLQNGGSLPDETVNYVASISPHLGDATPTEAGPDSYSAPVQVASAAPTRVTAPAPTTPVGDLSRTADGCLRNPDAAYDPSGCLMDRDTPHPDPTPAADPAYVAPAYASASMPAPTPVATQALPVELASYVEPSSARSRAVAQPHYLPAAPVVAYSGGQWAVQVGAFSSDTEARQALRHAQAIIGGASGRLASVVTRAPSASRSLYRARLTGFAASDATAACHVLHTHSVACFTVPVST
ncbi:lytic transglycosylase domain-containing protein [Acetobacter sp. DsW_063]|uniref:lytic transglycosylase domain-containing protein n=1 Tax=Acetobacter sp. DsW_063 TaxID=1514894 RepID=UPI001E5409F7|nr:lytic transglycosylase domain-containing protein [Acetobacter sp. DsW_063]